MRRKVLITTSFIGKKGLLLVCACTLLLLPVSPCSPFIGEAFSGEYGLLNFARIPERQLPPYQFHPEKELAKGKFLVAGLNLRDPRFSETVILLVHYDRQGAMGLIINRPTEFSIPDAFPDMEGTKQRTDAIYFGGPVALTQMLLLIRSGTQKEKSLHVFKDIYLSSSIEVLHGMIGSDRKGKNFRIYAGYAGWGRGQLEGEVLHGDWLILPADADTIFEKPSSDIWPALIQRRSGLRVEETNRGGYEHASNFH